MLTPSFELGAVREVLKAAPAAASEVPAARLDALARRKDEAFQQSVGPSRTTPADALHREAR